MTLLWSVFTKPWSALPADELGPLVAGLGFTGAEVPVRESAHVTPANAEERLPAFVERLRADGVEVISIAAGLDEPVFAACRAAGVPLIRTMAELGPDGYAASVCRVRAQLEAAAPLAERYGVQVGVQPHHGRYVSSALGVLQLLDGLPVEHFRVVWDAAHDALAGDDPAVTLELVAHRLAIVNLKNVVHVRTDPPAGTVGGGWKPWFVPGPQGRADWSAAFAQLERMGWSGPVCLSGQYSDTAVDVAEQVRRDLDAARVAAALSPDPASAPRSPSGSAGAPRP
ncbi:sugar phosphate isomerase/epimerase [Pseudonocardia sp. MH-G8]|uniref:sugar phosphate isomerase/epimerase family protein n=1 Tax=Pseudonocardia sp. MH-G8 TaxID=1854588 RepID=UPI000BA00457|nr:sugar phosphate isomerase/epimerase family protein [Pseudonocardia sp. MH-G8]OZM80298.1 sugar phosphate isomerase [Pseudonocardia sp. MH-G8]